MKMIKKISGKLIVICFELSVLTSEAIINLRAKIRQIQGVL